MNCQEFKIWIDIAPEEEILFCGKDQQLHVESCNNCNKKLNILRDAVYFMNEQKKYSLTSEQSSLLVDQIVKTITEKHQKSEFLFLSINKYAAVAVLIIGLLAGVIAGTVISSRIKNNSNPWSTEFTMLSDNNEQISYVFD